MNYLKFSEHLMNIKFIFSHLSETQKLASIYFTISVSLILKTRYMQIVMSTAVCQNKNGLDYEDNGG